MRILKPADVARRLDAGETVEQIFSDGHGGYQAKLAGPQASVDVVSAEDRTVDFVISTPSVDRYTDTIALGGWRTANWQRNPVVLWAHDDATPAIGRGGNLRVEGRALRSTVTFASPDVYPFADTVFRLIEAKIISAASVGFIPLKLEQAKDKNNRPFGLDIQEQELLEWSVVNIPANPDCLAEAKSLGIDVRPLVGWAESILDRSGMLLIERAEIEALRKAAQNYASSSRALSWSRFTRSNDDWKCGAARDLPIEDDDSWDGPAAEKAIFEACGFDGDSPDTTKARKAFLAYDSSDPSKKGSYKLPFAKMVDGKLKASKAGIRAAASRLPQADIPQSVKDSARKVLDSYEERMKDDKSFGRLAAATNAADAADFVGVKVRFDPSHPRNAPDGHWVKHLRSIADVVGTVTESHIVERGHRRGRHVLTVDFGGTLIRNLAPDRFLGAQREAPARKVRSLYHVAWLAQILAELGYLEACVEQEAEFEEDESPVPAAMHEALQSLGQVLLDMTVEEVAEMLDEEESGSGDIDDAEILPMAMALKSVRRTIAKVRAGRVLSQANEECLRAAHAQITEACDSIRSVFDQNDPENDDNPDDPDNPDPDIDPEDDDTQKAAERARRARAIKLKVETSAP